MKFSSRRIKTSILDALGRTKTTDQCTSVQLEGSTSRTEMKLRLIRLSLCLFGSSADYPLSHFSFILLSPLLITRVQPSTPKRTHSNASVSQASCGVFKKSPCSWLVFHCLDVGMGHWCVFLLGSMPPTTSQKLSTPTPLAPAPAVAPRR